MLSHRGAVATHVYRNLAKLHRYLDDQGAPFLGASLGHDEDGYGDGDQPRRLAHRDRTAYQPVSREPERLLISQCPTWKVSDMNIPKPKPETHLRILIQKWHHLRRRDRRPRSRRSGRCPGSLQLLSRRIRMHGHFRCSPTILVIRRSKKFVQKIPSNRRL